MKKINLINSFIFNKSFSKSKLNLFLKTMMIAIWIFIPICIVGANEFVTKYLIYEIWWYILFIFVTIAPYIIERLIKKELHSFEAKIIDSKIFQYGYFTVFIIVVSFIAIDFFNGLTGSIYSWGNIYDEFTTFPIYSIYLNFIRAILFLPSFVNAFVVSYNFWEYSKSSFVQHMTTKRLLMSRKNVSVMKKINRVLFWGYVTLVICVLMAYSNNPKENRGSFFMLISDALLRSKSIENMDTSFILHIAFFVIPIIIACIYYYVNSTYFIKLYTDCIVQLQIDKKIDNDELEQLKFVFFDERSWYYLGNYVFTYFSVVLIPALFTIILERVLS